MDFNQGNRNRIWYLLARQTAGEITPDEEKELMALLQQFPPALYTQEIINQRWQDGYKQFKNNDIEQAWEKHLKKLQTSLDHTEQPRLSVAEKNETAGGFGFIIKLITGIAACALIAFGIYKWMPRQSGPATTPELQELATQNGSRSQLVLQDGTKVWLNAGSKLSYPKHFSGSQREVSLEGEAYFDVTHRTEQPFLVHTNAFTVKVLGTSFNIRAYADEDSAAASLIRGSVEVELAADKNKKVLLRPNEKLTVPIRKEEVVAAHTLSKDSNQLTAPVIEIKKSLLQRDKTNAVAETAWVDNKLVFKGMSLGEIAQVLEKWYAVDIRFKNADIKKLRLNGTFQNESLEEILTAFSMRDINGGKQFSFKKDNNGTLWIY